MTLRLHNTLTGAKEPFEPLEEDQVRMYTCGPTVWNFAHVGNLRAFLFYDIVRRHLQVSGYRVTHVMNLTDLDRAGLKAGARVASDKYDKEHVSDFALWKKAQPGDEKIGAAWDAPFGRGRPGWHIECSAMSKRYLGDSLDIHAGGVDLMFPHHENEIAQSEAANHKTYARVWLHSEHLADATGEKMSKSAGGFT